MKTIATILAGALLFPAISFGSTLKDLEGSYAGTYYDKYGQMNRPCRVYIYENSEVLKTSSILIVKAGNEPGKLINTTIDNASQTLEVPQNEPLYLKETSGGDIAGAYTEMWIKTDAAGALLSIQSKTKVTGLVALLTMMGLVTSQSDCDQLQRRPAN